MLTVRPDDEHNKSAIKLDHSEEIKADDHVTAIHSGIIANILVAN